jgi:hypothetical protein
LYVVYGRVKPERRWIRSLGPILVSRLRRACRRLRPPNPTELSDADNALDKALAPKIGAIIDAYGNFDAHLSPDGKKFFFRSNRDGVGELYIADVGKPTEPAKKIVRVEPPITPRASRIHGGDGRGTFARSPRKQGPILDARLTFPEPTHHRTAPEMKM